MSIYTDSSPVPNTDLIRKTIAMIERNPKRWSQDSYVDVVVSEEEKNVCGTTMCFAGTALAIKKGVKEFLEEIGFPNLNKSYDFYTEARLVLGLDNEQAWDIFMEMTEDVEELKAKITQVTGVTFDAPAPDPNWNNQNWDSGHDGFLR